MNHQILDLLFFAIIIPTMISIFRFQLVEISFRPFIYLIICSALAQIIGEVLKRDPSYNAFFNSFNLIECFLILWQFKKWNIFQTTFIYHLYLFCFTIIWLIENIFLGGFLIVSGQYFCVIYSVAVVFMSITVINQLLFGQKINLLKNSVFLICCSFLLYCTVSIITLIFFIYGLQLGQDFRDGVAWIIGVTNSLYSIISTLAILWMPKKQSYLLQ
jgi:hypothetical protein